MRGMGLTLGIIMVILVFCMIYFGSLLWILPMGIVLWLSKVRKDKENYASNGKVTAIIGIVFFLLSGVYFSLLFSDALGEITVSSLWLLLMLGGGGFAMILYGDRYQQKGCQYLRYSTIIADLSGDSIDEIAAAYPKRYEQVCKDLQEMMRQGFFSECYLDLNGRKFISPKSKRPVPAGERINTVSASSAPKANTNKIADQPETRSSSNHTIGQARTSANKQPDPPEVKSNVIQCPNCGAMNILQEGDRQCEYCDSRLV